MVMKGGSEEIKGRESARAVCLHGKIMRRKGIGVLLSVSGCPN